MDKRIQMYGRKVEHKEEAHMNNDFEPRTFLVRGCGTNY